MKFDKWTLALAGLGVISLAAVARADEQPNPLLTAVSSTTISGYVDTSAHWNFGTGNANVPDYKFNGPDKSDGFNLNTVQLRIEKPLDESQWAAGYRVDLWFGPDANVLNTQSIYSSGQSDFAVRQAYVALRTPVGNGIDWKIGAFDSILGYESVESPNDPNYTRSYGHSIEPQTHTGILASYRFSELVSASAGIANTFGPIINERAHGPNISDVTKAESYKTYMGSIAVTAPESFGFLAGSTLYGGVVNGFSSSYGDNLTSWYAGATVATPVKGLRGGVSFDALDSHNFSGETWAVGTYLSFQATEKLSLHARGEYLRDRGDQKFFVDSDGFSTNPNEVLAITLTAQYDLWKNVISRLELRWDHDLTNDKAYGGTVPGEPELVNAWLLAANIIYKF